MLRQIRSSGDLNAPSPELTPAQKYRCRNKRQPTKQSFWNIEFHRSLPRLKGHSVANLFDITNAAMTEPEKIVAGDRLIWKRADLNADYANSA